MTHLKGESKLETFSRDFALFIDGIRIERGLTRLDLIDEIISLSQYKRYLRGAAEIPNNVVIQLADRLKYNITDFYTLYTKKHGKEHNQIRSIYYLIQADQYVEALNASMKVNDELIVSSYNKLFFDYCVIYSQHKLGRVSDIHVLSKYSEMIDYPNCINNESFNMVEMSILSHIVTLSSNMGNYDPANFLFNILSKGNLNFSRNDDNTVLPFLFYVVARVIYQQGDYERVLVLCEEGIHMAIQNENNNSLPHLFLLNSLAHNKLGDTTKAKTLMKKSILLLKITNNETTLEVFKQTYKSNFDIPLEELLKDISDLL